LRKSSIQRSCGLRKYLFNALNLPQDNQDSTGTAAASLVQEDA
jgi:hypothetical protein